MFMEGKYLAELIMGFGKAGAFGSQTLNPKPSTLNRGEFLLATDPGLGLQPWTRSRQAVALFWVRVRR